MENTHPLCSCLGLVAKHHFYLLSISEDYSQSPTLMQGARKWSVNCVSMKRTFCGEHLASFFYRRNGDTGVKIWKMITQSSSSKVLKKDKSSMYKKPAEAAWNA